MVLPPGEYEGLDSAAIYWW